jgi:DNA-binding protein Fis
MNFIEFIQNNKGHAQQRALKEFYYQLITDALNITGGNKTAASELLGMNRGTFQKWFDIAGVGG